MSTSLVRASHLTNRQGGCRFGVITSRRPKTANPQTRRVPTLPFTLDLLNKYEGSKEETSLVSTLREETTLSTPRSIREFIETSSIDSIRDHSALVIQRNWRTHRKRQRLAKMFDFFKKIRQVKYTHAFAAWKLALNPPADVARKYYEKFISFSDLSGILPIQTFLLQKTSFNTYMKTNFLLMKPSLNHEKVTQVVVNFNKPLISLFFNAWLQISQEHSVLKHSHESIYNVGKNRIQFGPLYWAYHVWKRWAYLHRNHKKGIYPDPKRFFYIPEWNYALANKEKQKRLIHDADLQHRRFLIVRVKKALRKNCLYKMKQQHNIKDIQTKVNKIVMVKAYRGFMTLIASYKLKQSMLTRILKFWYTYVDKKRMLDMFKDIHSQRTVLFTLNKMFRQWRLNIVEIGAYSAMMHDMIYDKRSVILRWVFLMMGDSLHFTFYSSFVCWRKIILSKKKTRKFMEWSKYHSKQQGLKKFVLDCFRVKANFNVDKTNSNPFGGRTVLPQMKKLRNRQVTIDSPTNYLSNTLHAYNNTNEYYPCKEDLTQWDKNDVKNLFLQVTFLVATRSKSDVSTTDPKKRMNEVKNYRIKNMLFNQAGLSEHRQKQADNDLKLKQIWRERLRRDSIMILSMEAHDEAIEYNRIDPKFGLHDGPIMYTHKEDTKNNEEEEYDEEEEISFNFSRGKDPKQRRHSVRPANEPVHPLMKDIPVIRKSVIDNVRKFRRSPAEIFIERVTRKTLNSRALSQASQNLTLSRQSSTYDSFIPIGSLSSSSFNSSSSFQLQGIGEALDLNVNKNFHEIQKLPTTTVIQPNDDINVKLGTQNLNVGHVQKKINFGKISPQKSGGKMEIIKEENNEEENSEEDQNIESDHESQSSKKETEQEEALKNIQIDNKKDRISLEELAMSFLNENEANFGLTDSNNEYSILTKKYIGILATLLGFRGHLAVPQVEGKPVQNISTEFPAVSTKISRLVRRINATEPHLLFPPRSEEKIASTKKLPQVSQAPPVKERKRQKLFEERGENFEEVIGEDGKVYKKSNCSEFSGVLFSGEQVLTLAPWENRSEVRKSNENSARSSYASLPTAKITVKGFEDIPGMSELVKEVSSFLGGTSKENEYSDLDETNEQAENQTKIVKNALEIADGVARKLLKKEAINTPFDEIFNFVDTTGIILHNDKKQQKDKQNRSEDEVSVSNISNDTMNKHHAFNTASRNQRSGLIIIEQKLTFTQELLRAIKESSKLMKPHLIKYYGDLNKIDPFKEYSTLKDKIKKRQSQINKQSNVSNTHENPSKTQLSRTEPFIKNTNSNTSRSSKSEIKVRKKVTSETIQPKTSRRSKIKELEEIDVGEGEVALTIGGRLNSTEHPTKVNKRSLTTLSHRISRNSNDRDRSDLVVKSSRINKQDSGDLCLTSRKMTPHLSIATLDTTKSCICVHEVSNARRKPKFTNMTASTPKTPDTLIYELPRPKTAPLISGNKFKVDISKEEIVSDRDIDFFMFVSPYIIPPELLSKLLEECERIESQTVNTARTLPH